MGLYRVQVNYIRSLNEKWSNVWHVRAGSVPLADAAFQDNCVTPLLALLNEACTMVSLLVSDTASTAFETTPINEPGTDTSGGSLLPLYNTMKALFPQADLGRPDLKYFKGYITEDLQEAGLIDGGVLTTAAGHLNTMIDDMAGADTPLVSFSNAAYSSSSIQPAVQMRQMHRKRRKTVVIP